MNVRAEITKHSAPEDVAVLLWLFERNHMESQWNYVARCTWKRYGTRSYESHRVWVPTPNGRKLYLFDGVANALESMLEEWRDTDGRRNSHNWRRCNEVLARAKEVKP